MAERDADEEPSERYARGFDDLFCVAKQCNAEAWMADFLGELLSAGVPKVNPTLLPRRIRYPCMI
jgi:hypothetical protein